MLAPPPEVKPGYATTEFWLSFLATLIGFLMASGVIEPGSIYDKAIGLVVTVLAALGYNVGRSSVKKAQALTHKP